MGTTSSSQHFQHLDVSHKPVYETLEYDLYDANDGYKKLSLFHFKQNGDPDLIDFSTWKTIRHPLIVQYLDQGVMKGKTFVLTEHVEPVARIVSSLSPDEIICGLSDILKALDFLHKRCKLSHNNVTPKSLFVSKKCLSWKLGCTQLMSSPDEETFDFVKRMVLYKQLNATHNFLPPEDVTPELCEPIPSVREIHRRDSFAIGCLIESHLNENKETELTRKLKSRKKDLRPEVASLLSNERLFTDCHFLIFKESLAAFGSYSEDQKKNFVTKDIIDTIRNIPEDLVASKVIPMLLTNRLVMLHPESTHILHPHLFVPEDQNHPAVDNHLVKLPNFRSFVIPVIVKLYFVRKINLRLILLQYLSYYASHIPSDSVDTIVVPQICLGLEEENVRILSATYSAIATLITLFGGEILKDCKKKRRKIFSNDLPGTFHQSVPSSPLCIKPSPLTINTLNSAQITSLSQNGHSNVSRQQSSECNDDWNISGWGSSPSSSPTSVTQTHFTHDKSSQGETEHDPSFNPCGTTTEGPVSETVSRNPLTTRKKKPDVHELDVKAIEIQVPEEVEDLFSEMEPRVNFLPSSSVQEHNNSAKASNKNLFALKEESIGEVEAGDGWSNDDDDDEDWISKPDDKQLHEEEELEEEEAPYVESQSSVSVSVSEST